MNKSKAALETYMLYRACGWSIINAFKKAWRVLK